MCEPYRRNRARLACMQAGVAALFSPAITPAQQVMFEDVAQDAGVNYLHWDGVPPQEEFGPDLMMYFMGGGAAAADYDGDGWVDLYVTRMDAPNLLFRNLHNGTFEEVAADAGVDVTARCTGCAWSDVDGDGRLDLYVLSTNQSGRNYLFINDGNGRFTESAVARGVHVPSTVGPDQNDLRHVPTVLCPRCCTSATFGDYDLDGDLDMVVVEWGRHEEPKNLLFANDGAGFFTDVTEEAGTTMPFVHGFSPRFADINNDNLPDLLVAADFGTSRLFMNLGNAKFLDVTGIAQVGTDENGMGSAVADVDNDGDLDWFVTSISDTEDLCNDGEHCSWGITGNRLYMNISSGGAAGVRFVDRTDDAGVREGDWGWGASFFDFDNDADLDLGMTNGFVIPSIPWEDPFNVDVVRLWENDGAGVMTEVGAQLGFNDTGSGKGFVVFDYDRDGDQDVYIANNAGFPVLYRNNGGNSNDWLKVDLRGTRSNTFGLGARIYVQVTPGGVTQMHEVNVGSNYLSHNEITAHFGLGPNVGAIHSVRVEWPASGRQQEFNDVAPNQLLTIKEP